MRAQTKLTTPVLAQICPLMNELNTHRSPIECSTRAIRICPHNQVPIADLELIDRLIEEQREKREDGLTNSMLDDKTFELQPLSANFQSQAQARAVCLYSETDSLSIK